MYMYNFLGKDYVCYYSTYSLSLCLKKWSHLSHNKYLKSRIGWYTTHCIRQWHQCGWWKLHRVFQIHFFIEMRVNMVRDNFLTACGSINWPPLITFSTGFRTCCTDVPPSPISIHTQRITSLCQVFIFENLFFEWSHLEFLSPLLIPLDFLVMPTSPSPAFIFQLNSNR